MQENRGKVFELRHKIVQTLVPLINNDYVLLDFHNFGNIGDYMIWQGQLNFLEEYVPFKKSYSSNYYTFQSSRIGERDVILLSGGEFW